MLGTWLVISECLLSQEIKVALKPAVRMRRVLPTREKSDKGPLGPLRAGTELAALMVLVLSALWGEAAARTTALGWDSLPLPSSLQDLQSQNREVPLAGKQSLTDLVP